MTLKLMTYNIQHGLRYKKGGIDLSATADNIRSAGADVCALNEVRGDGPDADYTAQTEFIAERLGWKYLYFAPAIAFGGGNPYGNAVVSRYPIISAENIPIPDPPVRDEDAYYETRCVLRVRIDVSGSPFTLAATHIGLAKAEQRNAVAVLLKLVGEMKAEGTPFAVTGDFNMTPDCERLAPLLAVTDDTARLIKGDALTFPSDKPAIKIDYILTGGGASALSAEVLPFETHDHRPVIAEIAT